MECLHSLSARRKKGNFNLGKFMPGEGLVIIAVIVVFRFQGGNVFSYGWANYEEILYSSPVGIYVLPIIKFVIFMPFWCEIKT